MNMSRYIIGFLVVSSVIVLWYIFSGDKIRTEITDRYDDGRKKTIMKFIGEGSEEVMVEKINYSQVGDTIYWDNYSKDGLKHGSFISSDSSGTSSEAREKT